MTADYSGLRKLLTQRSIGRAVTRHQPIRCDTVSIDAICNHENLVAVLDHLRRTAGPAPGPDGVTFAELGRSEAFEVFRMVSKLILCGEYRPGPARFVAIPKASGGVRQLRIRNIVDRVVAKALDFALTGRWDQVFLDGSHGFRVGRSTATLLDSLHKVVQQTGKAFLIQDDIKGAFDYVRIADVVCHHAQLRLGQRLAHLINVVLQGDDPARTVGIDQGGSYSPTGLNVILHYCHDQPLEALAVAQYPSWWRYADNVVYLAQDVVSVTEIHARGVEFLRESGFVVQSASNPDAGNGAVVDLHRQSVEVLGYKLSAVGNRLRIQLGAAAWDNLRANLRLAHANPDPVRAAQQVLAGWTNAYHLAFTEMNRESLLRRFQSTLRQCGHYDQHLVRMASLRLKSQADDQKEES